MRQHRINSNIGVPQDNMYDIFMRAIEIDIENIKIASSTNTVIDLISPLLDINTDKPPIQKTGKTKG